MDCCNYMSYRQSQYYGPVSNPYYENFPYPGDFYGHPPYHDYYGNSPYYTQQWPCAASFPDYVYNPKEARLRKAMREATRDRAMGAAPMAPPRPGGRRSAGWVSSAEDLMMAPQALRGSIGSPMCGTSGFPMTSAGNGQFISMNGYSKLGPVMPPHTQNNYLQPNPMAQLQHQADMWQTYQDTLRARQTTLPQYMVPNLHHSYQQQPPLVHGVIPPAPQTLEKPIVELDNFVNAESNSNESIPPATNEVTNDTYDSKDVDSAQSINEEDSLQQSEQFLPMYEENVLMSNPFDKTEDLKKPIVSQMRNNANTKSTSKALPDFNEAFGSTERGRFQSPPDPRLPPNKGYLDYFFESTPIKFDDYQI